MFQQAVVEHSLIEKMCSTMVHRGPDDEGIYTAPCIGLGQRRLSIIDLRRTSCAPLSNEDETIWVVFNGEIYNFQQLRQDLLRKGHIFRTASDTEVIVHLYEEYGAQCVDYMRGMFAFALWDSGNQRLFAARDRFGQKPFCYARTNNGVIFGSEIKAITVDPEISVSPNFEAIDSYLTYQYVPSPLTAFSNIFKLPPAHYLLCDIHGKLTIERYWEPSFQKKLTIPEEEIAEESLRRLRESVKLRLIADVPLGVFLSGGIDSGTIVALMAQESSTPIKTFSIGFEEDRFNELPYARLVAERYGTQHHEFIVKPKTLEVLPELVRHYNEPFADSSALPTYYVSKMTRQSVTVALSGDGGDENFAGYQRYRNLLRLGNYADNIPFALRRRIFPDWEKLSARLPYTNIRAKLSRLCYMVGMQLPQRYQLYMTILKPQERQACYTPYFRSLVGQQPHCLSLPWDAGMDSLDWMMRHDQQYYLPDCLMVKADRASMANSLEVRAPFLDHHFAEFTSQISSTLKSDQKEGKLLFRRAISDLLPSEILNKPKTGFGVPLKKWFQGDLNKFVSELLLSDVARKRNLFRDEFIKKILHEHLTGKRAWNNRLWMFLFLEMWFREFID